MRHRSLAVSTSRVIGVSAGRVESQYFDGSRASSGHPIRSHSSAWGSGRLKSREAGRKGTAAQRERSSALVPSRQAISAQAFAGSSAARALAESGW
jgi:hypothetical protein